MSEFEIIDEAAADEAARLLDHTLLWPCTAEGFAFWRAIHNNLCCNSRFKDDYLPELPNRYKIFGYPYSVVGLARKSTASPPEDAAGALAQSVTKAVVISTPYDASWWCYVVVRFALNAGVESENEAWKIAYLYLEGIWHNQPRDRSYNLLRRIKPRAVKWGIDAGMKDD